MFSAVFRAEPSPGRSARGVQPPGYLGRHKRPTPQSLSTEAKTVVMAVKSIIEVDGKCPYSSTFAFLDTKLAELGMKLCQFS